MKARDVIEFFGGYAATARALGITRQAVHLWGETVPSVRQWQIEAVTNGAIRRDGSHAATGTADSQDPRTDSSSSESGA